MEPGKPSSNVIKIQREAIKQKVTEAMVAEAKRKKLLADNGNLFSHKRIKELERRHEEERLRDQEAIDYLVSDLEVIQQKVADGSLNANNRIKCSNKPKPILTMNTDRFHRQILVPDINLAREYTEIHSHIDEEKRHRASITVYDEYKEKRKLSLLLQKQEVLTKLAAVTREELCRAGRDDFQMRQSQNALGFESSYSQRDRVSTAASDSSRASWATFNSRRTGSGQDHSSLSQKPSSNIRNMRVPALQLK